MNALPHRCNKKNDIVIFNATTQVKDKIEKDKIDNIENSSRSSIVCINNYVIGNLIFLDQPKRNY